MGSARLFGIDPAQGFRFREVGFVEAGFRERDVDAELYIPFLAAHFRAAGSHEADPDRGIVPEADGPDIFDGGFFARERGLHRGMVVRSFGADVVEAVAIQQLRLGGMKKASG